MVASELARGVPFHGRSRYEIPWETLTTVGACLARLQESRRICTASLELWPNQPHLDNAAVIFPQLPALGPIDCFLLGLKHESGHLNQIQDVMAQAREYRWQQTLLGRWQIAREARKSKTRTGSQDKSKDKGTTAA